MPPLTPLHGHYAIWDGETVYTWGHLESTQRTTGATPAKNTANAAGALRNALTTCNTLEGTKRFSGAVWISPRNGQRTS